jgi:LuxR family maltose regulon positive regulatory protein
MRAELARQRGDPDRTTAFARQGLAELTGADRALRSVLTWDLAMADWLRGRVAEAERALAAVAAERLLVSVHAWYDLGHARQRQGRLDAAQASYRQLLEIAGQAEHPSAALALAGMAEVLYERDELDAALGHATQAVTLCRQDVYVPARVAALTILAQIRQAQGDQAGALAAIGEAEQLAPSPNIAADLWSLLVVQLARLALTQDRVTDAARWVRDRRLGTDDEVNYPREREYLVLARVLLATGAPDQALGLLERWTALAVTQGRTGSVIELRALQALAQAACGDEPAAEAALTEAVALAAPEGYLRVFVDEGPAMAALFRRLLVGRRLEQLMVDGAVPREYPSRLAAAFERAGAPILPPARRGAVVVAGLVEPLSARELGLLAAGRSNRQIAEELVVSVDTVKTHVTHILGKLGAANRTQAVTRGRELGLLR